MPTEITTLAYKFDELSDKAKERVREWFNPDIDLSYVVDAFKEKGAELGYRVDDVQYRISHSQGDGASWTGQVQLMPLIERIPPADPNFGAYMVLLELMRNNCVDDFCAITRSSYFYNHSGTMGIDSVSSGTYNSEQTLEVGIMSGAKINDLFEAVVTEDFLDEFHERVLKEAQAFADDLYKALVEAYEWEISDEHIAECAEINEWLFDENGKII